MRRPLARAAVAVGQDRRVLGQEGESQAPGIADRDADQLGRFVGGQVTRDEMRQDATSSLRLGGQADRVSHLGRLTMSLTSKH